MNETPRRRITFTSSLNELSTDQLGNRVGDEGEAVLRPFLQQASRQILQDDVNGFSSTSDICFIIRSNPMEGGHCENMDH
jgi:hypothetical protein